MYIVVFVNSAVWCDTRTCTRLSLFLLVADYKSQATTTIQLEEATAIILRALIRRDRDSVLSLDRLLPYLLFHCFVAVC